jgi:hypothetical protein
VRASAAFLPLALTACTSVQLPAGPAPLDPITFFTGATTGRGYLDTLVASPVPVSVISFGVREDDGLRLIQEIREGKKLPRVRTWIMRPVAPGRYTGTLTDAAGAVALTITGARATVDYRTPSGLRIRQLLALQSDGRTILNRLEAYKYGIRVATLDETISKPVAK